MKTELEGRTKKFAVQIVKTVGNFPKTADGQIIGRQLLKAGTSIGANYREMIDSLHKEAGELLAILITIGRKTKNSK